MRIIILVCLCIPACAYPADTSYVSISSMLAEPSPRDELELDITPRALRILQKKLSANVKINKLNGLGSQLIKFYKEAKQITKSSPLLYEAKIKLREIISDYKIHDARLTALRLMHSPAAALDLRAAAWSVFQFAVLAQLSTELVDIIPGLCVNPNDLDIYYLERIQLSLNEKAKNSTSKLYNFIHFFSQ